MIPDGDSMRDYSHLTSSLGRAVCVFLSTMHPGSSPTHFLPCSGSQVALIVVCWGRSGNKDGGCVSVRSSHSTGTTSESSRRCDLWDGEDRRVVGWEGVEREIGTVAEHKGDRIPTFSRDN